MKTLWLLLKAVTIVAMGAGVLFALPFIAAVVTAAASILLVYLLLLPTSPPKD